MAKPRKKKRAHALSTTWDDARARATNAILGPRYKSVGAQRMEATQRSASSNYTSGFWATPKHGTSKKHKQRLAAELSSYNTRNPYGIRGAATKSVMSNEWLDWAGSGKWTPAASKSGADAAHAKKSRSKKGAWKMPKTGAGRTGRAKTFSSFDSALKSDRKKRRR